MAKYTLMSVKNPVLKNGVHYLTSDYKSRNSSRKSHSGIDIIGKGYACDYIVAIDKGTVDKVGYNLLRGYYVEINHGALTSVYFHLKKDTTVVREGNDVVKGQTIGYMGNTGQSSGAHLHFGVYRGTYSNIVDPLPYLEGKSIIEVDKPIAKFNLTRLLMRGAQGNDVKELQKYLNANGWRDSLLRKLTVDGIFGNNTLAALKKMQKKRNLLVDGIVGKNTAHSIGWLYNGK